MNVLGVMPLGAYCGRKLGSLLEMKKNFVFSSARRSNLQLAAAFHGFQHGDFISVLEVRADGNADADARDANA